MHFSLIKQRLLGGSQRSVQVKKNIIASSLIKVISIVTSLLLIPATINYVSSELYGVWLTLSTVISWLSFFDIGFGNGLRNKLSTAIACEDYEKGKIYISTTYCILGVIFFFVGLFGYFAIPYIQWSKLLNVSSDLTPTIVNVVHIVLITFVFQIILKLIQNVIQAYQLQALASAFDAAGNVISLIAIIVLSKITFPSLENIALVFTLSPIIVLLIASIILYSGKFKVTSPSLSKVDFNYAGELFTLGSKFFLIQIVTILLFQTTNLIISNRCGPESVTVYNITYKYLTISSMLFNIVLAPIWSAFTDAYAKKDYLWMRKIFTQLFKLCVFTNFIIIIMVAISPFVFKIWIGGNVNLNIFTTIFLAIYIGSSLFGNLTSQILNGVGKVRLQLFMAIICPLVYLPIAFYSAKIIGLNGIILAMLITVIPPSIVQYIQVKKVLLSNTNGIWDK